MKKVLPVFLLCFLAVGLSAEQQFTPTIESFNTGYVSPFMEARTSFDKYKSSCRILENMFVTSQGPVERRPGTKYIATVKDSNDRTRLIPFEYSTEDAYVIEMGDSYMRFYRRDASTGLSGQVLTGVGVEDLTSFDSVVAHWPLNDNTFSAVVIDSNDSHNGVASKYTHNLHNENGNVDGCFDLSGNNYITVSDDNDFSFDDSGDNPFTMVGWIFPTDRGGQQTIISKWKEGGDSEYKLYLDGDLKLTFELSGPTANLEPNCVSQWKLNENAVNTTVVDTIGTQNGVSTTNTSNLATDGQINGAFDLSGRSQGIYAVEITDDDAYSFTGDAPFSIAAWIFINNYDGDIFCKCEASYPLSEYRFYLDSSGHLNIRLWGYYAHVWLEQRSSNVVQKSTWQFVTMTYNGNKTPAGLTLYINGIAVEQTDTSVNPDLYYSTYPMVNTTTKCTIGASYNSSGVLTNFFDGKIDNPEIFNKELSLAEIQYLYNAGNGTEALVAGSTAYRKTDSTIDLYKWTFVAATYDSTGGADAANGITLYVNGSEVNSTIYNNADYTAMPNTDTDVLIGATFNISGNPQKFLKGKIDNVAVFSDDLNSVEISSLYSNAPYEIETPYDACEIWNVQYKQADNVMYLVDGNDIPQKLTRDGHTYWVLEDFDYSTGPFINENTDTSITIDPPAAASDITTTGYAISSLSSGADANTEAFDDDKTSGQEWVAADNENVWIGQNFSAAKEIKRIKIWPCGNTGNTDACPKHLKIEASNDGTTYTKIPINKWYGRCEGYNGDECYVDLIATVAEDIELYLNNDDAYQYWRVYITDNWGDASYIHILEIEMFEADSGVYIASDNIFKPGHEGSIWQINQDKEKAILKGTLDADEFSETSGYFVGSYSFITEGTWNATVTLERSTNYGATWKAALSALNSVNFDNPAETETTGAIYRVRMTDFVSGSCNYTLTITDQTNHGIIKINNYISPNSISATALVPLVDDKPIHTWREGYWSDYRGWPNTLDIYQERLIFGGSKTFNQTLWFGQANPNNYENFTEGTGDTMAFTIALHGQNPVRWLTSRDYLIIGTSGSVGKYGKQGEALMATSPSYQEQTKSGSAPFMAAEASDALLYIERGATKVREFIYSLQSDKYVSPDLTVLANDILDSKVCDVFFQQRPEQILWCVLNNGEIATMTYQREQEIFGWAKQNTDGFFESGCRIPGSGSEDEIWVAVRRTIDNNDVRYIEQFQPRSWGSDTNNCWFMDCALSYDDEDTNNLTGLNHLIGKDVYILGDSVIEPNEVVDANGEITIDRAAGRITAGLPFTSKLETMPIYLDPMDKPYNKNILKLWFDFYKTGFCRYAANRNAAKLTNINFRNDMRTDPNATAQELYTSDNMLKEVSDQYGSSQKHSIYIESDAPLPLTLRSITYSVVGYPK